MKLALRWSTVLSSLVVALLAAQAAFGQTGKPPLAFAAVDFRTSQPSDQIVTQGVLPDGQVLFRNTTARELIAVAYNVDKELVGGGPAWLDTDRFDIEAKAPPTASQADRLLMLQTLLGVRFKLTIRHDTKADPVFVLTVGKESVQSCGVIMLREPGRFGPRRAESPCATAGMHLPKCH